MYGTDNSLNNETPKNNTDGINLKAEISEQVNEEILDTQGNNCMSTRRKSTMKGVSSPRKKGEIEEKL